MKDILFFAVVGVVTLVAMYGSLNCAYESILNGSKCSEKEETPKMETSTSVDRW